MSTITIPANGTTSAPEAIRLPRLERHEIAIPIVGLSPFIPQRWSEKSKSMMRDKQQSASPIRSKKPPKEPERDAFDSTYWVVPGEVPGAPATAFKSEIIGACRFYDRKTFPMTAAKRSIFVLGEGPEQLVPLVAEWEMREDTPRNADGGTDLRYRNYMYPWSCVLHVAFIATMIDAASVVNLVDAAGNGGIGSWRPSSPKSASGTYGRFQVDTSQDTVLIKGGN